MLCHTAGTTLAASTTSPPEPRLTFMARRATAALGGGHPSCARLQPGGRRTSTRGTNIHDSRVLHLRKGSSYRTPRTEIALRVVSSEPSSPRRQARPPLSSLAPASYASGATSVPQIAIKWVFYRRHIISSWGEKDPF